MVTSRRWWRGPRSREQRPTRRSLPRRSRARTATTISSARWWRPAWRSQELFFAVALDDMRRAAATLRPTYERSGGRDGFVSFECTPDVADDTEATVDQALELWHRLDLPNVLIKVPATPAGVAAIEELTARGVNVNVTLLFSVERYEEVIEAYLRASSAGSPRACRCGGSRRWPRSSSRASIRRPMRSSLPIRRCGAGWPSPTRTTPTGAICTLCRRALAGAGKRRRSPQRPLWASTGTKYPTTPTCSMSSG